MIVVSGAIEATPDTIAELTVLAIAHSVRSRAEPGCISHNIHVDAENPMRLFFYEQWADREALAAHFKVPESIEFVRAVRRMGASAAGAQVFDAAPVKL